MKKFLSILAVVLTVATTAIGQSPSPGVFNYQGVARNSVGNVLINKTITLRLTVRDGAAAGPNVYQESRTVITNPFGLFNVQVGSPGATAVTGTIAGVNWGVNTKFIQVEIDPNGGSSFINIGTAQIASVPYSLYSSLSNDLVLPFIKTQAAPGTTLIGLTNSSTTGTQGAFTGTSASTDGNAVAVSGTISSGSPGGFSAGVRGVNNGTSGLGIGVYGSQAGSGWGVYGTTPSGIGVHGLSTSGFGVYGLSTSGVGVFGSSSTGNAGSFSNTNAANTAATLNVTSNGTGWAIDAASTNATTRALRTAGGLRFTGINEALNRILVSDATGNATWQNPAAVGVVTGSGTLNFVPKWTPNGTNLGNSKIFDDGTFVGVGTTTPGAGLVVSGNGIWNSAIGIENTATGMEWRMNVSGTTFGITKIPGSTFTPLQLFSTGGMDFSSSASTSIMRLLDNGNVGIGITAPTSRLQVTDGGTIPTASFTKTNAANTSNTLFVSDADVTSNGIFNGGIFATKGGGGVTVLNGQTVIKGFARLAGGIGVSGASGAGGISVAGTTSSGIGLVGLATAPTGFGLITIGQVQIQGQNAGLNRILTSDAVGTATWQDPATVGIVTGNGTLNYVPKWTPNGTNLGNSQIRDDGAIISTGNPAFNDPNSFNIFSTSASGADASLQIGSDNDYFGMYNENTTGKLHFTANAANMTLGTKIMTLDDNGVNGVGIGTVSPIAKLHAVSTPTTGGSDAVLGETNSTDASAVAVRGVVTSTTPGGFSAGVRGVNNGNSSFGIGVYGSHAGTGWGVYGNTSAGTGVVGSSNTGFGVRGASTNNHSGYFGNTNASNGTATLIGTTNGVGPGVQGINSGTGVGGWFDIYNPANTQPAVYASTDGTGNAGYFWNNNVANTTASLSAFNPSAGAGAFGTLSISGAPSGLGVAVPVGLYSHSFANRGIVAASNTNIGLQAASNMSSAIVGQAFASTGNAGVIGQGLSANNYGVVGNTAVGTGAGGYFTGGTTALRTLGGVQLTGINEGVNRILTTTSGTGQATWEDAATAGIVSGSGTLNYIPKWTPNGTTLGNSLVFDDGTNVGIGTITPSAQLHVNNAAIGKPTLLINQDNELSIPAAKIFSNGPIGFDVSTSPLFGDNSLYVQRGDFVSGTITTMNGQAGIMTLAPNGGIGIEAASVSGVGIFASSNTGTAIRAFAPTSLALRTQGGVRIEGQGAAAGYVLTSDAVGNATWQDASATRVAFGARGITGTVSIPFFTFTPITQWSTIEYEEGSVGNYNGGTGEYTVPKTGKYNISTQLTYDQPGASGSGYGSACIFVNGLLVNNSVDNMTTANLYSGVSTSVDISLNAGDLVRIVTFHRTSGSVTLVAGSTYNSWTLHLIK